MKLLQANDDAIKAAAFLIKEGGVVVYPTETVYGIGCVPSDPDAAQRICEIKERADKPLPLICSDIEMVRKIVVMTSAAEKLAARFWPGPLTIVLASKVKYSTWVTHGASTLGVRVTEHPVAQKLAKAVGGVIVSTSANISGGEPARSAQEAKEIFMNKVDIILDGGPSPCSESSTVVDLTGGDVWLLRKGPITGEQIMAVLRA
ncbi:threonylcarbamoyl-AMP synthase [Candidatus Bathyarchaeota archaeon RBG_13_52_12]|nr:MAG: threonylcarbamoyl-AMP synthase [Candidatus Bathyarchaeota archaeon RBG_13_52_12]